MFCVKIKSLSVMFTCFIVLKAISCSAKVNDIRANNSDLELSFKFSNDSREYSDDNIATRDGEDVEYVASDEEEVIQVYRRHERHGRYDHESSYRRGSHHSTYTSSRRSHGHRRSLKKTSVIMPSGKKYYITRPDSSKWSCGQKKTPTKLITLNPNGKMGKKEYDMVTEEMKNAVPAGTALNYQIVKIEKIVNGCFWKRYRDRQSVIFSEGHKVNERMLFHGSRKMTDILKNGFDERYAAATGAFGPGIYFSPRSSTSHGFTGAGAGVEGQMLVARVTVGVLYKAPTYPDTHAHAPPGSHSVGGGPAIGDLYNEVVVYRGEQAYAEYMITYKL